MEASFVLLGWQELNSWLVGHEQTIQLTTISPQRPSQMAFYPNLVRFQGPQAEQHLLLQRRDRQDW